MKKIYSLCLLSIILVSSCNTKREIPNTDIEVTRAFIKDILENNFKEATDFVLPEDTNDQYLSLFKKYFESKSKEELEQYKNADIVINEINNINDSVTIVNYSNTYKKNEKNKVKVVRKNGQWLVDLKYTFPGNQ
jgi:type IV secretory pathway component VirB8